ncbi:MAG: hypothetical protein CVU47_00690 [Chloroflexi bacterium HGW-Chloroflexi-9]|nr:MAG: hypothetical protein CVU47_00690 [Chloroflexi bacterium HGW-Chloroflexi-9]
MDPTPEPPVPIAVVVLAGGRSSRMGRDKAAVMLHGRRLLDRTLAAAVAVPGVVEVVVVLAPAQVIPPVRCAAPVTLVRDTTAYQGPLAGIAAGLAGTSRAEVALVLGCDTPFVQPGLLALLAARATAGAIVVPVHEGRPQPLCSAIHFEAFEAVRALAAGGARAASAIADDPRALLVQPGEWAAADPEGLSFLGVNTPEELARAEALAARLDGVAGR